MVQISFIDKRANFITGPEEADTHNRHFFFISTVYRTFFFLGVAGPVVQNFISLLSVTVKFNNTELRTAFPLKPI